LKHIKLEDIAHCFGNTFETIRDKYNRIDDKGVNHGRAIYYDRESDLYYKIFHKDYVRRTNFEMAIRKNFFDGLIPALVQLIVDGDDIVGYVSKAGQVLSDNEFDSHLIPNEFTEKLINKIKDTDLFFYDFVPSNIIRLDDGQLSLIDLESVYEIKDLFNIEKHNAKIKPDSLYDVVYNEWRKQMKPISFIQPSRNNLKYLKWSYNSIRKNLGYIHEICMADDFSNDGTWEWMQEIADKDPNVKIHRNEGPTRLGHTILYDTLINDYATNDIVMIYHADMYALPGLDEEINKYIKKGVVVSGTRIEPPLHPAGPEKILADYGIEPEEFQEQELLRDYESLKQNTTTEGIFAPWAIMKEDFQSIGGHDPLYAPQSKEDSDIFNRFLLNGYKFVQTWEGFVYHMTCRGSRFADGAKRNPNGEVFMKNRETDEWLAQNIRSTRNFIRKWGHFVKHDALLKPIVPPKYDVGIVIENCTDELLQSLEPWCSVIYVDTYVEDYIVEENKNTLYNLHKRVRTTDRFTEGSHDIEIKFDGTKFNNNSFQYIQQLSEILANDELEEGSFELDIFKITINNIQTYEEGLIKCER
jgi:glycosyltransferase involved in cell wall biosynthesis